MTKEMIKISPLSNFRLCVKTIQSPHHMEYISQLTVIYHLSHIYFLATDLQDHNGDQRIFEVMTLPLGTRWLVAFL
jgi:hypothetical protein